MDQEEIIKKAKKGEAVSQEEIDNMIANKKKEVYKKAALSTVIGFIMGFIPNILRKFFNKK